MRERYVTLVESQANVVQRVAAGLHALPDVASSAAAAQAASRFLNNERVTLRALVEPLLECARRDVPQACDRFVLDVLDWSELQYRKQHAKRDRLPLSNPHALEGYELQASLLLDDRSGTPLAPAVLSLRAADGVHCSRCGDVRPPLSPLDELDPAMTYVERLKLGKPVVHIVDAEADSVAHYREWSAREGRRYLVRADDRLVEYAGRELKASQLLAEARAAEALTFSREVTYHGRDARQFVVERAVRLTRAGQRNRPNSGDRRRVPGPPLDLRLVISEVRDLAGKPLAVWYLLTNVEAEVDAATIALWYYWRWGVESFFKLLKSAGLEVERWQQESAAATARRLLVAAAACVVVWRLDRSAHPQADQARKLLIRLSGRQMKYGVKHTKPALLAGLWTLLAMLRTLELYDLDELKTLAQLILQPTAQPPPRR
ncbi:MAG: transposase [Planctomycetia bacterium]|nr:transposase [Planctomycetia bacterium]